MEDQYLPTVPTEIAPRQFALPLLRVSERAREPLLYAGAAVSYVSLGVFFTQLVQFWMLGFAWLLVWTWILPALLHRLRR